MLGKKYIVRIPVAVHEDCTWEPGAVVEVTHVYDDDGGFDLTDSDGESGSFAPSDLESWFTPETIYDVVAIRWRIHGLQHRGDT